MEQTLRNLIAEGKTKEAIAELRRLTTSDVDLNNEVNILAARFTKYKTQYHLGLADTSLLDIELNRINNALLSVIERSGNLEGFPNVDKSKRWLKISAYLVATIGVLASIAQISGWSMKDFITPKDTQTTTTTPKSENVVIKGIVKTEAGDILPDVKIIVEGKSMTTDSNGYFELAVKAHDDQTNYRINISKGGFETKNETYIPDSQISEFRLHKK